MAGRPPYRVRGVVEHGLFFFQAEDGIRDYKVTGVQTCALPILADGTVEITPSGEIDLDNAHVIRDAVNDVLTRSTPRRIILDLQRVMLIDSIGKIGRASCRERV